MSDFTTNFPATENPISESGKWQNGGTDGGDWNDIQTTTNKAFASSFFTDPPRYDDCNAHLKTSFRTFANDQFVETVVVNSYGTQPFKSHEMEHLLRFEITANNARGYEVIWGIATTGYVAVVLWNGPLSHSDGLTHFQVFYDSGTGQPVPTTGDILRSEISGNIIKLFRNGVQVGPDVDITADDLNSDPPENVWASGQPGMGSWVDPTGDGTLANYGWSSLTAGDAAAVEPARFFWFP